MSAKEVFSAIWSKIKYAVITVGAALVGFIVAVIFKKINATAAVAESDKKTELKQQTADIGNKIEDAASKVTTEKNDIAAISSVVESSSKEKSSISTSSEKDQVSAAENLGFKKD